MSSPGQDAKDDLKYNISIPKAEKILEFIEQENISIGELKEVIHIIEIKGTPIKKFEPNMKNLIRIMKTMLENLPEGKTSLALKTNLNYGRLSDNIEWLEDRGLVESIVSEQKIEIALTEKGRQFRSTISGLENY